MRDVFIRVDDRLLHGQVVVSWIPYLQAKVAVIADDEYANDEFMRSLIESSGPEDVRVHVKTIDEAAVFLKDHKDDKILVLLRSIEGLSKLIKKVKVSSINIGGLGAVHGRKRYYNSIHLSEDELNILKDLANENIDVEVRILPKDKAIVIKGN